MEFKSIYSKLEKTDLDRRFTTKSFKQANNFANLIKFHTWKLVLFSYSSQTQ